MVNHLLKCSACGRYTMEEKCPQCKQETLRPLPAKFSPPDKYGKYRREVKKKELIEKGLY